MDKPKGQSQRVASETTLRMRDTASDASRRMRESAQEVTKMVTKLADRGAQTTAALTEANQRVLNEFMGLRGSSRAMAATSATSRCRACCTRRSFAALTPTRGS